MESSSQKLPVNPISLHFTGSSANLEAGYIEYEHTRNLWHLRLVLIIGVFLYSVFHILDFSVAPALTTEFAIIRFVIVSPLVLIMLGITYLPIFQKIEKYIMIFCVILTSGGYIVMGLMSIGEMQIIYLIGVLVCLMFNYNLVRIPFLHSLFTGIFISATYCFIQIKWGTLSETKELVYLISFLSVPPILAVISYTSERANRKSFYLMDMLAQQHKEMEDVNIKLNDALDHVKQLGGLLPICAECKNIRDDKGYWKQIESYISEHSEAEFSHSICPDCASKLYPDRNLKND